MTRCPDREVRTIIRVWLVMVMGRAAVLIELDAAERQKRAGRWDVGQVSCRRLRRKVICVEVGADANGRQVAPLPCN